MLEPSLFGGTYALTTDEQIWVAAGTYLPTKDIIGNAAPADPRDKTFFLDEDLLFYGGFNGTETLLSQRNFITNVTILSGDLGSPGDLDNAFHVLYFDHRSAAMLLDGFTVRDGNAEPLNGGGNRRWAFCQKIRWSDWKDK
ncbi:MAG: hypothetical protein AAB316_14530 [Bacteroidota bacterium]